MEPTIHAEASTESLPVGDILSSRSWDSVADAFQVTGHLKAGFIAMGRWLPHSRAAPQETPGRKSRHHKNEQTVQAQGDWGAENYRSSFRRSQRNEARAPDSRTLYFGDTDSHQE
jgi:hypothetical protein